MLLEERHGGHQRGHRIVLVHLGVQFARCVFIGRRAANEREEIDGISEIAFGRKPAGDVFEMRVETTVFVDHQHNRAAAFGLRPHQVAVDFCFR